MLRLLVIVLLFLPLSTLARDKPGKPNNWGKWGKDDQRGAANYISPKHIVKAAKLIKKGQVISLAIPIDSNGPVFPSRIAPQHIMTGTGADYVAGQPPLLAK